MYEIGNITKWIKANRSGFERSGPKQILEVDFSDVDQIKLVKRGKRQRKYEVDQIKFSKWIKTKKNLQWKETMWIETSRQNEVHFASNETKSVVKKNILTDCLLYMKISDE